MVNVMANEAAVEKVFSRRIMPIIDMNGKPKKLQGFKADVEIRSFRPTEEVH
jgi:hypothetical protein